MSASRFVRFSSLALLCGTFTIAGCFESRAIDVQLSLDGKPTTCADIGDPDLRIHLYTADVPKEARDKEDVIGRCSDGLLTLSNSLPDGRYVAKLGMSFDDEARADLSVDYPVGTLEISDAQPIPVVKLDLATVDVRWTVAETDEWFQCTDAPDDLNITLGAVRDKYRLTLPARCTAGAATLVAPVGDYGLVVGYSWFMTVSDWTHVPVDEHGADVGTLELRPWR